MPVGELTISGILPQDWELFGAVAGGCPKPVAQSKEPLRRRFLKASARLQTSANTDLGVEVDGEKD